MTVDPGRTVGAHGQIVYTWPPTGRYAELWLRLAAAVPEDEREAALALLLLWSAEHSTLVGYEEDGVWYDTEPNWQEPTTWT